MMKTIADTIIHGSIAEVKQAAESNEHLNFIDEYGYTPLIETCIMDAIEKAKVILSYHPDINMPDLVGNTALYWAVDNHNLPLCELLLKNGADPNAYSIAGMPILVNPLLRKQTDLKSLLLSYGAKLTFAYDFIHAKMLGHRFSLTGFVDILNAKEEFVEISLEGFILEFTLEALRKSVVDYRNNFAARKWQDEFGFLHIIMNALSRASRLIRFQHYNIDHKKHMDKITPLLMEDPLILPIAQEGHAITLIRYGNLLALCDRATYEGQDPSEDKVKIFYMSKSWKLTAEYVAELIYVRQIMTAFHKMLLVNLGLQEIATMPIHAQKAGNCSWANIEACIPALFYMLCINSQYKSGERLLKDKVEAMSLYRDWQRWDQDRSLDYFIQNFSQASQKRRAMIVEILCAVLFETCSADNLSDLSRIKKIVPIIQTKGFEYVAQSYLNAYWLQNKTLQGGNFKRMLRIGSDAFEFED